MSQLFDDITRVMATPVTRREALKLIAGTVGAVILSRFVGAARPGKAQGDYCDWIIYTHPCADICCRYDYDCASTGLLNGADTYGICCAHTGTHLCSGGGYGWCCETGEDCGTERFTCVCGAGYETCGNTCCNTAAGEICCDPDYSLCCTSGVECCYDASDAGTCCPDGTECVPASATGFPPGHVCCPADQACIGQCCPDGELCFSNLMCCPQDRINSERNGCCPSGFTYFAPTDSCCLDGHLCGDICCTTPGTICRNGTCQACPGGQTLCFDTCCVTGTCCFGKCCGDGQTCTGECTTLETISQAVDPSNGGTLNSSDGGVTINFMGIGYAETVQYTSQAQPGHALPVNTQLLRSFTLTTPTAVSKPQAVEFVFYTMRVRYTEATLAAMGVESEFQLQILWWNTSSSAWVPAFLPEIDRSEREVIVTQALLGEFALVAGEENPFEISATFLPLVMR